MFKNGITTVGIRLTRRCNMKCMYCNIQDTVRKELGLADWKKAIDIIKELDVGEIVILGGEPTLYPNIIDLVDYIANKKHIKCSLTTNALKNFDLILELLNSGLNSLGVSVDNLNIKKSISPIKAKNGLELIDYLIHNYISPNINIINYTVLNKNNIDTIFDLIEYMDKKGVQTYILPFHWGNEGVFDHRRDNKKYAFVTKEEVRKYNNVINEIIAMKKKGYRVKNSIKFLEISKHYIQKLNWKCQGLSELRIDSDGKLVCCCDNIGKVNKEFTIFDLKSKNKLEKFYIEREKDAKLCKGCLWPSSFEAELKREETLKR